MSIHRMNYRPAQRSPSVGDWALIGLALAGVLGCYAVAAHMDQMDDAALHELAQAERTRLDMPQRVAAAYEAGMSAALAANRDTPQGVALAQACLGSGFKLRSQP
jgi:hypothetical protein